MREKKYINLLCIVLLCMFCYVFAGDASRIGTAAGVQLEVPVGARDLAMGGANIAFTEGVEAIYWNPAGLPAMQKNTGALFSTMTIFNDIHVNYMSLGVRAGKIGMFGFSIKAFDFGDIPLTTREDSEGEGGRTFSPTFFTGALTYAKMLTSSINVGTTLKIIHESIPRAEASAIAMDIGLQYHGLGGVEGVSFGIVVKNIGTNMKYKGPGLSTFGAESGSSQEEYLQREASEDQLPASVDMGVGYNRVLSEEHKLLTTGLFQHNNFGNDAFKFGMEYLYNDLLALRAGYQFLNKTDSEDQLYNYTLGAGIIYNVGGIDILFDYAFRNSQYFDGNNIFCLRLGF